MTTIRPEGVESYESAIEPKDGQTYYDALKQAHAAADGAQPGRTAVTVEKHQNLVYILCGDQRIPLVLTPGEAAYLGRMIQDKAGDLVAVPGMRAQRGG